jgi:3-methyladenine DNA glycosylase AlkC
MTAKAAGLRPQGPAQPFKNRIDTQSIRRLAVALKRVEPNFAVDAFVRRASRGLGPLELKARIAHVAAALAASLSVEFAVAAGSIERMLDLLDRNSEGNADGDADADENVGGVVDGNAAGNVAANAAANPDAAFGPWELWPVTEWVARAGLSDPERALALLGRLTRRASAEFAVRPFIDAHPHVALCKLREWVRSRDEHLRRLASEGTRPCLPWAPRLKSARDPRWTLELLEPIVDDDSEYVRRSVSNHLNDLCREDEGLGLRIADEWWRRAESVAPADAERAERLRWVVRRGLRSLVKRGHAKALRLLGHNPDAELKVSGFRIDTPVVQLGEALRFTLTLASADREAHRVVLDYAIGFPLADGRPGRKVFKWTTLELAPGQSRTLERRQPMRAVSTRTARAGRHALEVQANGRIVASGSFRLRIETR